MRFPFELMSLSYLFVLLSQLVAVRPWANNFLVPQGHETTITNSSFVLKLNELCVSARVRAHA